MKLNQALYLQILASCLFTLFSCNHSSAVTAHQSDSTAVVKKAKILTPAEKKTIYLTDISRFIQGSPMSDTSSKLYQYSLTPDWKAYSQDSKEAWAKFDDMTKNMESWRMEQLSKNYDTVGTVFYPFGGPDYLFANIFFPHAKRYILIGMENAGTVPEIETTNKDSLKFILNMYKKAIENVTEVSYFKTKEMMTQLTKKAIDGTAPIIMLFMAHAGKNITDVKYLNLNQHGDFVIAKSARHQAVEIDFTSPGDTTQHQLIYLTTNLADGSLSGDIPAKNLFNKLQENKTVSLVKSATYLMHKSYFSIIRNTVLHKSCMILQDDSGIAYKFFDHSIWDITLYGVYVHPIPLFKEFYEADLQEAYKNNPKPLNFRYGYNEKSGLLMAVKK